MFKVVNEYYIQNEETGEYLDLKKACGVLNEQQMSINQVKKENEQLKQRVMELDDLKWIRENTVWEQMPTRARTCTKTSLNGDE